MKSTLASAFLGLVAVAMLLMACGEAAPERTAIRLQANAVGGGQVYFDDLASQDTVLWFWAPW